MLIGPISAVYGKDIDNPSHKLCDGCLTPDAGLVLVNGWNGARRVVDVAKAERRLPVQ